MLTFASDLERHCFPYFNGTSITCWDARRRTVTDPVPWAAARDGRGEEDCSVFGDASADGCLCLPSAVSRTDSSADGVWHRSPVRQTGGPWRLLRDLGPQETWEEAEGGRVPTSRPRGQEVVSGEFQQPCPVLSGKDWTESRSLRPFRTWVLGNSPAVAM